MNRYAYDENTFRLARMRSREFTKTGDTYSETGTRFQDNTYTYDLSGNIIALLDRSDVGTELANTDGSTTIDGYAHVIPTTNTFLRRYTYDSLSRLLTADGACHDQRAVAEPWSDYPGFVQDLNTIRAFTEQYGWDANGNMLSMRHVWDSTTRYNRQYSMVTGTNRLDTLENTTASVTYSYQHDPAGNVIQENTERHFTWDHADRLHTFRNQVTGSAATKQNQYLYDAGGQRVMKVATNSSSTHIVTIYIDGVFEHREEITGSGTTVNDEIHVTDGGERIARLRVGTAFTNDNSPAVIYVLSDHLGSSSFTLTGGGAFFSREEYSPFGESTHGSYAKKRYRFTGGGLAISA